MSEDVQPEIRGAGRWRKEAHHVNLGSTRTPDGWRIFCSLCGFDVVNKVSVRNDRPFSGHGTRPEFDVEQTDLAAPTTPVELMYCCETLGWVPPPDVTFDHRWETSRPLGDG